MNDTPDTPDAPKSSSPQSSADAIDTRLVRRLADILKATDLTAIEVERGDLKIRVAREMFVAAAPMAAPMAAAPMAAAPTPAATSSESAPAAPVRTGELVKSPMVGTAYLRASPESKPFVEIGSIVKIGDKILLVEAMKTFNEIVAPRAGKVVEILVEDGTPVEYDQPLLVIE